MVIIHLMMTGSLSKSGAADTVGSNFTDGVAENNTLRTLWTDVPVNGNLCLTLKMN
jgi:hypothetical protein